MGKRFTVPHIASSEITSESAYLNRRNFMLAGGVAAAPLIAGTSHGVQAAPQMTGGKPLQFAAAGSAAEGFRTDEAQTPFNDITSYCNFYEFGTDKGDPARYAHQMTVDPWSIRVEGEVGKPGKLNLEDILSGLIWRREFTVYVA